MAIMEDSDAVPVLQPRRTLRSRISGLAKSRHDSKSSFLFSTSISATGESPAIM